MARIAYNDMTNLPPDLAEELAKRPNFNLYRMLANGGSAALGYLRMGSALRFDALLDPVARELLILRTGSLCEAAYELDHHQSMAADMGISDDKIRAAVDVGATSPVFDEFETALLRFVEEVVVDGKASEAAFAELAGFYSNEELIETTLLTGFYMLTSRFLQTFDMDLDGLSA
ncbi:MAG: carboxymuconolactone decarboxylase family protein [Alphaproteobacteria bacterium]|nr:carboxymuconolactone decarboxylase family protein [Alphaproteobacteria bacterium]